MLAQVIAGTEPGLWERATRHSFLREVGQGRGRFFGVWLAQDALFVSDLIVFQSRLIARAPRSSQAMIAEGVVGLLAELDWFDRQAGLLGVSLTVEPLTATRAYRALLRQLDAEPYPRAMVALWLLERIYLEAWRYAGSCGSAGPYAAAVAHWTDPGFVSYVADLEDRAGAAGQELNGAVQDIVSAVLACEADFWDMARDGA